MSEFTLVLLPGSWEEQVNSRRPTTTYPVPAAGVVGPDELFQRGVIARRYYLEGRTRVQIAEEFGLSRFKVARMLEEALESGMVEIKILDPASIDIELSTALQRQYSLSTPMQSPPTATTPLTGSRRWPRPPLN